MLSQSQEEMCFNCKNALNFKTEHNKHPSLRCQKVSPSLMPWSCKIADDIKFLRSELSRSVQHYSVILLSNDKHEHCKNKDYGELALS